MRKIAVLVVLAALSLAAAPKPSPSASSVAPETFPHSTALFLGSLCNEGGRQITFKARAHGVRFFFEEPSGVTVYRFEKGRYVKEEVLKGFSLDRAVKKYAQK